MHALHETLLDSGFDSRMHYVHPKLATPNSVNVSEDTWLQKKIQGLGPDDVVIVPELMMTTDNVIDNLVGAPFQGVWSIDDKRISHHLYSLY